jgi:hypothetical protein
MQALGWGSRYPQHRSMRLLRSMPRRAPGIAHEPSSCLPCCSRSRASLRSLQSAARNVAVAAPAAPSAAPCGHVARCPCGLWCCGRLQLWFAAASNRALRSAMRCSWPPLPPLPPPPPLVLPPPGTMSLCERLPHALALLGMQRSKTWKRSSRVLSLGQPMDRAQFWSNNRIHLANISQIIVAFELQ